MGGGSFVAIIEFFGPIRRFKIFEIRNVFALKILAFRQTRFLHSEFFAQCLRPHVQLYQNCKNIVRQLARYTVQISKSLPERGLNHSQTQTVVPGVMFRKFREINPLLGQIEERGADLGIRGSTCQVKALGRQTPSLPRPITRHCCTHA